MRRWRMEAKENWQNAWQGPMVTVAVFDEKSTEFMADKIPDAHVWWDIEAGAGMCCACSTASGYGPSQSCRHVRAVRRWASKEYGP